MRLRNSFSCGPKRSSDSQPGSAPGSFSALRRKAPAVLLRAHAKSAGEGISQHIDTAIPATVRHILHGSRTKLECPTRGLQPDVFHILCRRGVHLTLEHSNQRSHAGGHAVGQQCRRQLMTQVLAYPKAKIIEARSLNALRPESHAELRLATRTPKKQHEVLGDIQCHLVAQILADQGQRQVDACGYASRRIHIPVPHPYRTRIDFDLRIALRKLRGAAPVRGCPPTIQQTCLGKRKGTHADGAQATNRAGSCLEPGDGRSVQALDRRKSGGHQQGVDSVFRSPLLIERAVRPESNASLALDMRAGTGADQLKPIGSRLAAIQPVGQGEHLSGPDDIQGIDGWQTQDNHTPRRSAHAPARRPYSLLHRVLARGSGWHNLS